MNEIITLNNVTYKYSTINEDGTINQEQQKGLDDINLSIFEGEYLALVGHNGSGKSTLAKLFNGLLIPQSGEVKVFGMDTADNKLLFDIRKNVGMVFQNPDNQMIASIVEDDVAFGPENIGVPQKEIVERVEWALHSVNMLEFKDKTPYKLSGGQKQRIAIAGVLAIKPRVLVLDESTAMLDPQGRLEVLNTVQRLNKEEKMTIVLITHFMEEVLNADRVVVLNNGKIVMTGAPKEIFTRKRELKEIGLDVPKAVELSSRLKEVGINVDLVTSVEELGAQLCQLL